MKPDELKEQTSIEIELIEATIRELLALYNDVSNREPTIREKMAAAGFLAQFYNGIENILKQISHFYNISLPKNETWHIELFKRFCTPSYNPLPVLFDEYLQTLESES
jgi:hypothetical protein